MPALASLFVSLTADDAKLNRTLTEVRSSLTSIDRTKVSPKITLSDSVKADIDGLSSKLTRLAKQRVALNVDSTTAKADVTTLTRQLDQLQRNRHNVPLSLSGEADRAIDQVKKDLRVAERKQTTIPLKLERIEGQIGAVKSSMDKLPASGEKAGKETGRKFGSSFGSVAKGMLAGAALLGGFNALTGFLKDANAEARESQKVGATTSQIIKATGGAAKISSDQISALTTSLSNKSGMDDELIQSGANLLLTFKNVKNEAGDGANVFDRATAAAVDLSAAGFGSVTGSSKMLGKALNDPLKGISALGRAGVTFTQQQKDQIAVLVKNGDTLGAQKIIMKEVESQVGGVAAASATMGEKLTTSFNNFKEQLGTAMLPIIDKVAAVLVTKVIPAVSGFIAGIQSGEGAGGRFAAVMQGIGSAIAGVYKFVTQNATAFKILGGAIVLVTAATAAHSAALTVAAAGGIAKYLASTKLVTAFTRGWAAVQWVLNAALTANPIGIVVVAVAALAAGLIYAYKHSAAFRDVVNAVGAALKTGFLAALEAVKTAVSAVGAFFVSFAGGFKSKVLDPIVSTWNAIGAFFKSGGSAVTGPIAGVFETVRAGVVGVWGKITGAISTAWNAIGGFFKSTGSAVSGPVVAVFTTIKDTVTVVFGAIGKVISTAFHVWIELVKIEMAIILTVMTLAWDGIKFVVSSVFNFIRDKVITPAFKVWTAIFTAGKTAITTIWTNLWSAIKNDATAAWTFVKDKIITPIWTGIKVIFTTAIGLVVGYVKTWWTNLTTNIKTAFTFIKDKILTPIWTAVKTIFTTAIGLVVGYVKTWWTNLTTNIKTAFTFIKDKVLTPIWTAVKTVFTTAIGLIVGYVKTWWTNLTTNIKTAFTFVKDKVLVPIWTAVKKIFTDSIAAVLTAVTTWWTNMKSNIKAGFTFVKDKILTPIWTSVKKLFSDSFTAIVKGTGSFITNITRVFEKIKGAFSKPWDWVKKNVFDKIASVYNKVAGVVGATKLNLSDGGSVDTGRNGANSSGPGLADGGPVKRAGGGLIRGRGHPRQDNIAGIDRNTGVQTSWVSVKEYVTNARQYAKNKRQVETINAGGEWDIMPRASVDRQARGGRRDGGEIPGLWLGGGTKPAAGAVSRHGGYGWARWAGDINEPGRSDMGHPIVAYKAGVVAAVKHLTSSYGNHVRVNHPGNERTLYAHQSRIIVSPGQAVREGQKIGEKGESGNVTGPHLHFELAGGSNKITDKITGAIGGAVNAVLELIKPREMFRKAAEFLLNPVQAAIRSLAGDTPFGQLIAKLPNKVVDMLAGKLPASFGIEGDSGPGASGPSSVSGNAAVLKQVARSFGWDTGGQWGALYQLVKHESGFRNTAQNPSSTAYGMFQFLNSTWSSVGGHKTSDPALQSKYGLKYIRSAYGNPAHAWAKWQSRSPHWYADGGPVELAAGGLVRGGRGGISARIGEGRQDELVTPLPRGWKTDKGNDGMLAELVALIRAGQVGGNTVTMNAYNPLPESTSQSTNKGLQRAGALGLVN